MGMNSKGTEDVITDINVTPLVDVCLVLVIIFMAVAPFAVQAGIKVLHSQTQVGVGKVSSQENVRVRLNGQGQIFVNDYPVARQSLYNEIGSALVRSRDKVVVVTAEAQNKVKDVVTILDVSKQAGAAKVAIMKSE